MISRKSIDEVLDVAQVEDIVGETVELRRRGSNLIGLCPFHNEKTPSFHVSPSKNIYKCFGCGKGGRSIDFLMDYHKMTFVEAIRYIATKYNIHLEETELTEDQKQVIDERENYFAINEFAASFYHKYALESDYGKSIAMTYFESRKINMESIKKFQLGFAPREGDEFVKAALKAGFDREKLMELGLMSKSGKDFFVGRIMFPIKNHRGRIAGFAGRILDNNKKLPKYINSIESPVYTKREILYGAFDARISIRQKDNCILAEGYTDIIGMNQYGIENVVATSGTSLTDEQIELIKRHSQNVLFLFDGDDAGVNAALRGVEKIITKDMNVRVAILPDKEDPDSYIRKVGHEKFTEFLEKNSQDFLLFKANISLSQVQNDPTGKSERLHEIIDLIAQMPDPLKRNVYASEMAALFDIDIEAIKDAIAKSLKVLFTKKGIENNKKNVSQGPLQLIHTEKGKEEKKSFDLYQEKDIVRVLMAFGNMPVETDNPEPLGLFIVSNISDLLEFFDEELYKKIILEYIDLLEKGESITDKHWLNHENQEIRDLYISFTTTPYYYSHMWEERWQIHLYSQPMPDENFKEDAIQAIMRFRLKKLNKLIEKNQEMLKEMEKSGQSGADLITLLKADIFYKDLRNEVAKKMNTVII